jgi:hypothetical protein
MDGERTIAAKTRPRKRSAAEVRATAEVPATMAAEMATTVKVPSTSVPSASVTASTVATAASRGSITGSRQRGRKNNDGNANIEF